MKKFDELLWSLYTVVWFSPLIALPVFFAVILLKMSRLGVVLQRISPIAEVGSVLVGIGLIIGFVSGFPSYRNLFRSDDGAARSPERRYNKVLIASIAVAAIGTALVFFGWQS